MTKFKIRLTEMQAKTVSNFIRLFGGKTHRNDDTAVVTIKKGVPVKFSFYNRQEEINKAMARLKDLGVNL